MTVVKKGRFYHAIIDGRSIGKRRSRLLAGDLFLSRFFKPARKFKGVMDGEIGTISGFRIYEN